MQHITSRQNPRLKEAARLIASSRDRRKAGRCVLEGEHLIDVYMTRVGMPEFMIVVDTMVGEPRIAGLIARMPIADVVVVSPAMFADVSTLPVAIGAMAVVPTPTPAVPATAGFHVLLDDLQDPGNVGSILRTAAAAGVEQVLLSKHCAFAWSPKVLRAGQGAHFLTIVVEAVDLCAWAREFSRDGGKVVAMVAHGGMDLYATPLRRPIAFAIGNEGAGLSERLLAEADTHVTIPMPGGMESLNAGAATAVVLFEAVRRRSRAVDEA